jgi:hypothetical protein
MSSIQFPTTSILLGLMVASFVVDRASGQGDLAPQGPPGLVGRSLAQIAAQRGQPIQQTPLTSFPIVVAGPAYLTGNIVVDGNASAAFTLLPGANLDLNGFAILTAQTQGSAVFPALVATLPNLNDQAPIVVRNGFIGGQWNPVVAQDPYLVGHGELLMKDLQIHVQGGVASFGGHLRGEDLQIDAYPSSNEELSSSFRVQRLTLERSQLAGGPIEANWAVLRNCVVEGIRLNNYAPALFLNGSTIDLEGCAVAGYRFDDGSGIPILIRMPAIHQGTGSFRAKDCAFGLIEGAAVEVTGRVEMERVTLYDTGGVRGGVAAGGPAQPNRLENVVAVLGQFRLGGHAAVRDSTFHTCAVEVGHHARIESNLFYGQSEDSGAEEQLRVGDHSRVLGNHFVDAEERALLVPAWVRVEDNSFGGRFQGILDTGLLHLTGPRSVIRDNFLTGDPQGVYRLRGAIFGESSAQELVFTGNLVTMATDSAIDIPVDSVFGNLTFLPAHLTPSPLGDPRTTNYLRIYPNP